MSSRTLGDAMELMSRYLTLRVPHLQVCKRETGNLAWYVVSCDIDLGPLHGFIMDAMLFGCVSMGAQLTGSVVDGLRIVRRGPEPAYFQRFRSQIPVPVEFGATENALVIPAARLDLPARFTDDQLAASSRAQCEEALRQLTEDAGFACRVRRVIETSHPFPPKLARVAGTLFVSERTLKRRLQEEEASFQQLVDQVRLERAQDLLRSTGMNLSQIADALGYADAANFTRAFKRWTGTSPSQYRSAPARSASTPAERALATG
jgi:AraC-like DNA-binding protein